MTYDIRRLCRLSKDGEERSHWLNAFKTKYKICIELFEQDNNQNNQYNSYN